MEMACMEHVWEGRQLVQEADGRLGLVLACSRCAELLHLGADDLDRDDPASPDFPDPRA
jgi:hypothetical protein